MKTMQNDARATNFGRRQVTRTARQGAKPGDLPVQQAVVNYSLVTYVKTVKALGLTVLLAMLGLATR